METAISTTKYFFSNVSRDVLLQKKFKLINLCDDQFPILAVLKVAKRRVFFIICRINKVSHLCTSDVEMELEGGSAQLMPTPVH